MISHDFSIVHEIPYVGLPGGTGVILPATRSLMVDVLGMLAAYATSPEECSTRTGTVSSSSASGTVCASPMATDSAIVEMLMKEAWLNVKPTSLKQETMFMKL